MNVRLGATMLGRTNFSRAFTTYTELKHRHESMQHSRNLLISFEIFFFFVLGVLFFSFFFISLASVTFHFKLFYTLHQPNKHKHLIHAPKIKRKEIGDRRKNFNGQRMKNGTKCTCVVVCGVYRLLQSTKRNINCRPKTNNLLQQSAIYVDGKRVTGSE